MIKFINSSYREYYIADENIVYGYHVQFWEIRILNQSLTEDDIEGNHLIKDFLIEDRTFADDKEY